MKKISVILLISLLLLSSCKKNPQEKTPANKDVSAKTEYTVVYEPNKDYNTDRIIVTEDTDTVDDNREVTLRDVIVTLNYTGMVNDTDINNTDLDGLYSWYLKGKPLDSIEFKTVTVAQTRDLALLYAREHLYSVSEKDIDNVFSDLDDNEELVHIKFKTIMSRLTMLFDSTEFKFNINADEVLKITITPSRNYFINYGGETSFDEDSESYKMFIDHCITLTDKNDIADMVRFLNDIVISNGEYHDEVITGTSDYFTIYDDNENVICSFVMFRDNYIRLSGNKCFYTLADGYFSEILDKIIP